MRLPPLKSNENDERLFIIIVLCIINLELCVLLHAIPTMGTALSVHYGSAEKRHQFSPEIPPLKIEVEATTQRHHHHHFDASCESDDDDDNAGAKSERMVCRITK